MFSLPFTNAEIVLATTVVLLLIVMRIMSVERQETQRRLDHLAGLKADYARHPANRGGWQR